ncbi:protein anachronism-like [Sergentomyia squamirostris]
MGKITMGEIMAMEGVIFVSFVLMVTVFSAPIAPEFEGGTILDLNNPDPNILRQHNINISTIRSRQAALRNRNLFAPPSSSIKNETLPLPHSVPSPTANQRKMFEERALESIREMIARNILWNDTRPDDDVNNHNLPNSHDIAAYPVCHPPRNTNETFWNEGNSYNLYFEPPQIAPNMNLSAAILRLYKIETPNMGTSSSSERRNQTRLANDCGQVDELLRITVSAYVKKHPERKKRIYSSTMVDKSFVGWVELDVRQAVKLWEKPSKNLGLAIDVHDQDENPLKASLFFHQHSCEASAPFPWSFLTQSAWPFATMEKMPRHPRIDYKMCSKLPTAGSEFPHWHRHFAMMGVTASSGEDIVEMDDNGCPVIRKKRRHTHHNHRGAHA